MKFKSAIVACLGLSLINPATAFSVPGQASVGLRLNSPRNTNASIHSAALNPAQFFFNPLSFHKNAPWPCRAFVFAWVGAASAVHGQEAFQTPPAVSQRPSDAQPHAKLSPELMTELENYVDKLIRKKHLSEDQKSAATTFLQLARNGFLDLPSVGKDADGTPAIQTRLFFDHDQIVDAALAVNIDRLGRAIRFSKSSKAGEYALTAMILKEGWTYIDTLAHKTFYSGMMTEKRDFQNNPQSETGISAAWRYIVATIVGEEAGYLLMLDYNQRNEITQDDLLEVINYRGAGTDLWTQNLVRRIFIFYTDGVPRSFSAQDQKARRRVERSIFRYEIWRCFPAMAQAVTKGYVKNADPLQPLDLTKPMNRQLDQALDSVADRSHSLQPEAKPSASLELLFSPNDLRYSVGKHRIALRAA
jgi:hypothetical protein